MGKRKRKAPQQEPKPLKPWSRRKPLNRHWTDKDLEDALRDVREKKCSIREAAGAYTIPKTTLHKYVTGKLQVGARVGRPPLLTTEVEEVNPRSPIHMSNHCN